MRGTPAKQAAPLQQMASHSRHGGETSAPEAQASFRSGPYLSLGERPRRTHLLHHLLSVASQDIRKTAECAGSAKLKTPSRFFESWLHLVAQIWRLFFSHENVHDDRRDVSTLAQLRQSSLGRLWTDHFPQSPFPRLRCMACFPPLPAPFVYYLALFIPNGFAGNTGHSFSAVPGAVSLLCCLAICSAGMKWDIATCILFFQPVMIWPSPFIMAS